MNANCFTWLILGWPDFLQIVMMLIIEYCKTNEWPWIRPPPPVLHANKLVELAEPGDQSECEKTISQCLWPTRFPKFLEYCMDIWIFYVYNQSKVLRNSTCLLHTHWISRISMSQETGMNAKCLTWPTLGWTDLWFLQIVMMLIIKYCKTF